jgi:DNA-binding winged helix-turn-helix (wHTH) protein/tetratricopeptide (TPR) repeat protein
MASPAPAPTRIRFDAFELDAASGELRKAGILLKLRPQPFRVLLLLIEQAGQVVTREEIQRCLWADSTFVDFEHGINFSINQIRGALADSAENPRYVETIPRRGYRFIGAVEQPPAESITVLEHATGELPKKVAPRRWPAIVSLMAMVVAISAAGAYVRFHRTPVLTEKDTVVLADFMNKTGDPVFDNTLKTALSVSMQQSPFLKVLSDDQVEATLQLMTRSAGTKLTPDVVRELCERAGSKAYIAGSIGSLGHEYVIALKAVNCQSGDTMVEKQVTAAAKEGVLDALGGATSKLREELGESLATVQKFDVPLMQATTSSLEALQAYSLGAQQQQYSAAVPFYHRAIQLDPNFAGAYSRLGSTYFDLGENYLAAESVKKAYDLRGRVSKWERSNIELNYQFQVTGNLEKALETLKVWAEQYPRSAGPPTALAYIYSCLGNYDKYLSETRAAQRNSPDWGEGYANLMSAYFSLNRLKEAKTTAEEAFTKKLDSPLLHFLLYQLAFLQNESAGMAQQVDWAAGQPGVEDVILSLEADTAAFSGRLGEAREFSRQATASAQRAEKKETAATYETEAAIREALFGNPAGARLKAATALSLSTGRDVQFEAALALALIGDAVRAQALADNMAKQFPENTVVQLNYLPTVRAQLALSRKDSSKAIEILQVALPYELGAPGTPGLPPALYPVYVRAGAYHAGHQGGEAAAEFQKMLDHRGIVVNEPIGALAHLQIGRAYAMQGDTTKAHAAYQDFLALWKDADPDIPILKEAKAEYAKLQ